MSRFFLICFSCFLAARAGDVKIYSQYDTLLLDKLLIVSKSGRIYNYDLKYGQIRWQSDLGVSLQSTPFRNGTHYFQPYDDGTFLIYDYGQFYKVTSEQLELMFQNCEHFQNQVSYNNQLIFFIDIATGNLKQLSQYELSQLLSQPRLYEKGVIINIAQKYILDLDYEDTNQHSSKIQINFLLNYLRGDKNHRKQSSNYTLTKQPYGLVIDHNNRTVSLELNEEIFEVFAYDPKDGLFINVLYEPAKNLALSNVQNVCEPPQQCVGSHSVNLYRATPFLKCLAKIHDMKYGKQLVKYEEQSPTEKCEQQVCEPHPEGSKHYLMVAALCIIIMYLTKQVNSKPQLKEVIVYKDVKTVEYRKEEAIKVFKERIIGIGVYGTVVYEGELQGKEVAVKQIKKLNLIDQHTINREIEIQKHLNNPNIVKIYWHEETPKYIKIAMEKCLLSLREFVELEQNKRLSEPEKEQMRQLQRNDLFYQRFLSDMLVALQNLHERSIVHRDIRPDNILLNLDGLSKLADFGLSRSVDNKKFTQNIGTIGWRAREVILNQKYTIRADVFSLGCVFYYLVTKGEHPYGKTNIEQRIMEDKPNKLKLPQPEMTDLVSSMIGKNRKLPREYLEHAYFWSRARKLQFICECSDYLETFDSNNEKFKEISKQIFSLDWGGKLGPILRCQMRPYDQGQLRHLIRLIRNVRNHYHELSPECKALLGPTDDSSYQYWSSQFPGLFWNLFLFATEQKWQLQSLK